MSWADGPTEEVAAAARALDIWPLDASNAKLLDAVHPRQWTDPEDRGEVYDLIAIGCAFCHIPSCCVASMCKVHR